MQTCLTTQRELGISWLLKRLTKELKTKNRYTVDRSFSTPSRKDLELWTGCLKKEHVQ
jgi:RNase P/RNase MRP subunit p30